MDLTPREKQAHDLRHSTDPPMPFREIGERMGLTYDNVRTACRKAAGKLDGSIVAGRETEDSTGKRLEYKDPERAATAIDAVTDPRFKSLVAAAKDCGLPESTLRLMLDRLERDYLPVKRELEEVKSDQWAREFSNLSLRLLQSITPEQIDKMAPYQRVVGAAIAVDKHELLSGRPTARVSVEDRRELNDLIPVLLREAERRGLIREINPDTGKVRIAHAEDIPAGVRTQRDRMPVLDAEVIP